MVENTIKSKYKFLQELFSFFEIGLSLDYFFICVAAENLMKLKIVGNFFLSSRVRLAVNA
jgi:hypothetical protein